MPYYPRSKAQLVAIIPSGQQATIPLMDRSQCVIGVPPATLDPATVAWIAAVVANGGAVSAGRQTLVDNLIVGMKSDGVWTKLDRLWLHAGEDQPSALTDLVADVLATAVGAPTFTVDRGFTGQDLGSPTKYINSNTNLSTLGGNYTRNAAHLSVWSVTNTATVNGGVTVGSTDASSETDFYITFSDGNVYGRINDNPAAGSAGAPGTRAGHWFLNRSGAALTQIYQNAGLFASPNATSGVVANSNTFILCNDAGGASNGTPQQLAMSSFGGSFTGTDVTNFYNRLRTYMTGVGVP